MHILSLFTINNVLFAGICLLLLFNLLSGVDNLVLNVTLPDNYDYDYDYSTEQIDPIVKPADTKGNLADTRVDQFDYKMDTVLRRVSGLFDKMVSLEEKVDKLGNVSGSQDVAQCRIHPGDFEELKTEFSGVTQALNKLSRSFNIAPLESSMADFGNTLASIKTLLSQPNYNNKDLKDTLVAVNDTVHLQYKEMMRRINLVSIKMQRFSSLLPPDFKDNFDMMFARVSELKVEMVQIADSLSNLEINGSGSQFQAEMRQHNLAEIESLLLKNEESVRQMNKVLDGLVEAMLSLGDIQEGVVGIKQLVTDLPARLQPSLNASFCSPSQIYKELAQILDNKRFDSGNLNLLSCTDEILVFWVAWKYDT